MNEVYRYVQDSEIKKILKETDGIGTAATQAAILKELIDSGMLIKKGKNLISSQPAIRENINSAQPITVQSTDNSNSKKSSKKSNVNCPRCGAPMFLRNGKNGSFWGCSNYPECKMTANDNNGKPVFKKRD